MLKKSYLCAFVIIDFTFFYFPDTCSQKRDAGICPGNVPRFYFDNKLGRCQLFSYGGCGGNTNNFETIDECAGHCGGPRNDVFLLSNLQGTYVHTSHLTIS